MRLSSALSNCILKRGLHHVPGEVVPVNDCFFCNKFVSYVEIKSLPVQLVPVAPCLLYVMLCEESVSVLFVATL